jgi:alkylation response protein AidB-like acyl-CoA dehydrogenase
VTDSSADPLARVAALAPTIAAASDEIERSQRLTPALVDALHDAGMFRLLLPRALGGAEVDPATFVRVTEAVAKIDASTAWVLGQTGVCAMSAAYLSPPVAQEVFGPPRAVLAWGAGPVGRAVPVGGGYRVTGTWSFASGGRHATWLGGHSTIYGADDGTPRKDAAGEPEVRTMLFPASAVTWQDAWNVIGLRGTGSDTYGVTDLFVPADHSLVRDVPAERRQSGPLYCFSTSNLYAAGFAGVALGIARAMFDAFVDLAGGKTRRGTRAPMRENAVIQAEVARLRAGLESARAYLFATLDDLRYAVERQGELNMDQRVAIRLAATSAIHRGVEVADRVYHAAGASAIFAGGSWERRFRDIHAAAQQVQGRDDHYESVGRHMLGLPIDTTFI